MSFWSSSPSFLPAVPRDQEGEATEKSFTLRDGGDSGDARTDVTRVSLCVTRLQSVCR